ncbi:MAG: nuclease [Candidatus Sulfotelmatobacter sp.]|nr:nuclease [Candidatus Sulfotelmatobacter sp.]
MNGHVLPLDAFVRAVGINRGARHAFFLGAGASITSGIPSAQACIWEWKRDIFVTNNPGLEAQFGELSLAGVRQRIQRWLDRRGGYPADGSAEEYSFYIEACYPNSPENRRVFFQEKSRVAKPHVGYQLLCLLAETGLVGSVWTTNFDGLVGRAAAAFKIAPVEVGIDCQQRAIRMTRDGELLVVSLHGDYRYDRLLKNTVTELAAQEESLRESLVKECTGSSLIVSGYSGRDASLMEAFRAAYMAPGTGTLYWCVHDIDHIPPVVLELIETARNAGRQAFLVSAQGFDNLLTRLALHCLTESDRPRVAAITSYGVGDVDTVTAHFQIHDLATSAIVKSNAFEIECPSEVLAFDLKDWPKEHVWQWVRKQTAGREVVAVPHRTIVALGTVDDLKACFGNNIKGEIQRVPVTEKDLRYEDGAIVSLMREALVRSMAANVTDIATDGKHELWFNKIKERVRPAGVEYSVHESVQLFIRKFTGRTHLVLKPSVKVRGADDTPVPLEVVNPIKLRVLGWQHNREFNDAVNAWRGKLLTTGPVQGQKIYEFPVNCGSTFRFAIRKSPVFAVVGRDGNGPELQYHQKYRHLMKQHGVELREPELVFSNRTGSGIARDTHPVLGVVKNRPFDYALTTQGFAPQVRIGVICPKAETRILQSYLQHARQRIEPGKYEKDYLPTYPGFEAAFGLPSEIPEPGSAGWVTCPELDVSADERTQSVEAGRNINRALDDLRATYLPNVVLIFFPQRWQKARGYKSDEEEFNTHHFVKAYAVQRGLGTQFLDQSTLSDETQCRVWWWLSLAMYVKSMRTPWLLDGLDPDTAFVGLGYSVRQAAASGQHIVLGCSHIYSSRGEGLQYRLSKIENPVFFGGNPFLSKEDARLVGERIRELFFESRSKLPSRVVIHKRTPFRNDERIGLREGLSGVANVEMLEIVVDDSLRYLASHVDGRGELGVDGYPVRRGTVVKLDGYTALVWVHGASLVVGGSRPYFQGKRRIPAPLVVRRHAGTSDLRLVAEEITGLSKMNWNTFDLYTKLPATVHSSNEIARIGSLLERFGSSSYDFRLFM